jgi:hypothetical protein
MALVLALAASARAEGAAPPCEAPGKGPDEVRRALADVARELDRLRADTAGSFRVAQKDLDALKEEVARLRKEVEGLRKRPPTTRSSAYPRAESGAIRLVNAYSEPVQVVVGETIYRLAPGETRLLRGRAPGPFTYEVVNVQGSVGRVLRPGETFTIRVYSDQEARR